MDKQIELVSVKRNQPVTDSLQIAKHFHKRHDHVVEAIRDLVPEISGTKKMFFESKYQYRGQDFPMFYMNRNGFMLLVMGFTGKKALEWKLRFIDAFDRMECLLLEMQGPGWKAARVSGITTRHSFTDHVKVFVDYAAAHGSQHAGFYYKSLTELANKVAGVKKRTLATAQQLCTVSMAENIIARILCRDMAGRVPYKTIYGNCKDQLERFREIAFLQAA
jgi:Rha family phage regulatory protein